jgi:RNA polymerase sigma factor (sigma-70 family)
MIEGRRVVAGEAILSGAAMECSAAGYSREEVIEALVREHSRLVYRIAHAVLHSHHDAEDATQETFIRVLRYSSKLAKVENPKTWLARIAWRVAVDRSKRRRWSSQTSLDDPEKPIAEIASADALPDDVFDSAQLSVAVETMIAALPGKLREPLILSAMEEMSPREIAAILKINEAAVRSRVFRARQILKEKLAHQTSRNR